MRSSSPAITPSKWSESGPLPPRRHLPCQGPGRGASCGVSRSGPQRLCLDGRFLARGDERIFLKAVTFGPFPAGEELAPAEEFPRLAECGFNAVRVYQAPDEALLDAAGAHGLAVLAGVPWEWGRDFLEEPRLLSEGKLRLLEFLRTHQSHPALGALLVANEIPSDLVRWMGPVAVRESLEELIDTCRRASGDLLIAYANYPSTEYLEPRNADFTAFNVFLEHRDKLRRYLPRLQNIAGDRPVVLTEFGLDTIRHDEGEQAEVLSWYLEECLAAGVAGATVYAWSDRWASGGQRMDDWAFGLTRPDRSGKPAHERLGTRLPRIHSHRDALPLESPPRISVVVCTHNGAARLPDCLAACLDLDYPDCEIIVVDDGSTDETAAVVAAYPEVQYVHQEHTGLSVARNCGANLATGEWIAFTDDDCEPDRDWLFWIARACGESKVGAIGGPNIPPEPEGIQEAVIAAAPGAPSHVLLDDLRAEHLPGCNLCVRRRAFEEIGGFQPQFETAGDDVDFCWRLLDGGWDLAFVPAAFVWHRRRTSFLRYLKQQAGYGRAEALLWRAHPDRFTRHGIAWQGSVYGGGTVTADAHAVIYFGTLGLAGYQGLEDHAMPRRELAEDFHGPATRVLLSLAETIQPWARALARWRHGGPAPAMTTGPAAPKVYRDDLRDEAEMHFLASAEVGREELLASLWEDGWQPSADTAAWDLERQSERILTTNEKLGPHYRLVKVRVRFPLGRRREILAEIDRAALEAGLRRV